MKGTRILLVDDHQVVRKGLKLLFMSENNFNVVGDCGSGEEALSFLEDNKIDVLVTDITMPGMNGIELLKKVKEKYPEINIMVLTMHLDEDYIIDAIEFGAKAYLGKDSSEKDIIDAVKSAKDNDLFLTKSVSDILARSLINKNHAATVEKKVMLTKREKEILLEIVNGLSNKMIGVALEISERTVNAHRYNIMRKLDAKNSADLVRIAFENNLV